GDRVWRGRDGAVPRWAAHHAVLERPLVAVDARPSWHGPGTHPDPLITSSRRRPGSRASARWLRLWQCSAVRVRPVRRLHSWRERRRAASGGGRGKSAGAGGDRLGDAVLGGRGLGGDAGGGGGGAPPGRGGA